MLIKDLIVCLGLGYLVIIYVLLPKFLWIL